MTRLLPTTAAFLSLCAATAAQQTDVLFLGNSYTARNDLPVLFEGLALSGGHTVFTDRNTPGGNSLGAPQSTGSPHASNTTSLALIAGRPWDVVVLQDQSFIPTIPTGLTQWTIPGVQSLATSIAANDPTTRVVLYQTWGRRDGGQFSWAGRSTPNFADFDAMQDALTAAYDACAAQVGAEVAPVGETWRRSRSVDPLRVLHDLDGSHPNLGGSYLTACVFYARVFGESPRGLGFLGGLPASDAAFLQETAHAVVFGEIGTRYCTPGSPNSTGLDGRLAAVGSEVVGDNDITLTAAQLPMGSFGFFLTSRAAGTGTVPGGSSGVLCLGGSIGRYVGSGQIGSTGATDSFELRIDLARTPQPTGFAQVAAGETWFFQAWHRDAVLGQATSNFTDAVSITFR